MIHPITIFKPDDDLRDQTLNYATNLYHPFSCRDFTFEIRVLVSIWNLFVCLSSTILNKVDKPHSNSIQRKAFNSHGVIE